MQRNTNVSTLQTLEYDHKIYICHKIAKDYMKSEFRIAYDFVGTLELFIELIF